MAKGNFDNLIICIPTYKRKWPIILSLIRYTPDMTFTLCVRKDDFEQGYYNEPQFDLPNINYMLLENVSCIGETREAILQNSIAQGYEYCMMIDDTQFGIHDASERITNFHSIIQNCLDRFDEDPLANRAIAFNFARKSFSISPDKQKTYFISQLCQTYILNLKLVAQYDLHFQKMDVVGVEDLVFYIEAYLKDLVVLSDTRFIRIGQAPSVRKEGGCHVGNENIPESTVQYHRFHTMLDYLRSKNYDISVLSYDIDEVSLKPRYFYFNTLYARQHLIDKYKFIKDFK